MVNTSGLARCPFALGSIRFCRFSFALSHFFLSPLLLLIYSRKSLHFSAKTDYLPIVVLRLWHGCLFAQCIRVCACVCASIRMQQRPRQVNMTVGTKQRELVRANVKWPTFLAVNSIPSTPFVHRPLFRLLTRLIRPFSFSFILLFLPQLSPTTFSPSSSVRVARPRCRLPGRDSKRFTRGFSRGIQTKINRTTKGRVVHLVQVCREENQRTLMREVIDCRFLSFKG